MLAPAQELALLSESQVHAILADLSDEELAELEYDWSFWARPEQMTPPGDWNIWFYLAGRGAGKTRTDAEDVKIYGLTHPKSRIGIVAPTYSDARDTCIEGDSGLLSVLPEKYLRTWNRSLGELILTNGTRYKLFSSEEPERLRGPQHHRMWFEELCAWRRMQETWDNAMFGLRLGRKPQVVISSTPKPLKLLKDLVKRDGVHVTRGSTFDNAANLAPAALEELKLRYLGTRTGRQELYAEILEDNPGALWTRAMIESSKVHEVPDMRRIVVSVDPAVTNGENSDATGIVVAGVGVDNLGYVLYSEAVHMSPDGWAKRVVALYHYFKADTVVAEVNQGGDLIVSILRTVDRHIPVKLVRATRGKIVRAEPVAALWEQQKVKIVI